VRPRTGPGEPPAFPGRWSRDISSVVGEAERARHAPRCLRRADTPDTFAPGLAEWAKGSIMTDELASMGVQALLASLDATDATQTTAAVDA
jgi:hypothetical protein